MSDGSHGEVQLENEFFRVTRWTIEPGGAIPLHRHEHEYVVVPLANCSMQVVNADGSEFAADLITGQSYTRPAGAEHRIENRSGSETVSFAEVERLS